MTSKITVPQTTTPVSALRIFSDWRFWVPLVAQTALILAIPTQAVYTHVTGTTVVLQTQPVDPYDLLRGYYVTLSYDISRPERLESLPGWATVQAAINEANSPQGASSMFEGGTSFYVVLQAPQNPTAQPPQPWQPVAVQRDRPANLPNNQVALQGTYRYGRIIYGLEAYYIPEDQRIEINERIGQLQSASNTPPFVVEVKVGGQGQSVPLGLWLEEQPYRF